MKRFIAGVAVALLGCGGASQSGPEPRGAEAASEGAPGAPAPADPGAPAPTDPAESPPAAAGAAPAVPPPSATPPADSGLNDLATMTFGCPKEALNAAAREAAKVPSQGSYQFAYFGIVSDSHHAAYEVHFKSNYQAEPLLKYCVAMYCQQGWDPTKTQSAVTLMPDTSKAPAGATKVSAAKKPPEPKCGDQHMHIGALPKS